ncbi:MAG: four helix bundle protein [Planctomyces sp.]
MNEKQPVSSYRDLIVWQKAMTLAVHCYSVTEHFPRDERFGIVSQMRRSSCSIPANIAEGHGRRSTGAFLNHLSIARGSLMELETHLILSEKLNFVSSATIEETLQMTSEISRMISGLMQSLERQ